MAGGVMNAFQKELYEKMCAIGVPDHMAAEMSPKICAKLDGAVRANLAKMIGSVLKQMPDEEAGEIILALSDRVKP